jgi:hypothetical protein
MRSFAITLITASFALFGARAVRAEIAIERSVGQAQITQVVSASSADLVVLGVGYEAGFRQGMICNVTRGSEKLGELVLVDLRPRVASALIVNLTPDRSLQPGDTVIVKTVSSRN